MTTHVLEATSHVDPVLQIMDRADGIGHGSLGMLAGRQRGLDGCLQIAHIVHGVEDAEDIHAVDRRALDERLDQVVRIVPVAKQVLPAQQHLLLRVGHGGLDQAQPLPGILPEIADAGIEGRTAPALHRPIADLIQLGCDREHVLETQSGREQRLVGVAQDDISDREWVGWLHAGLDSRRLG
jgi:hypothetical protein